MKRSFYASAVINGLCGGAVQLKDDAFYFKCQKLTVPEEYRQLRLAYSDIGSIKFKKFLKILSIATIELKNGKAYKFWIFNRREFIRSINEMWKK